MKHISNACKDAERLYNTLVEEYSEMPSEYSDRRIKLYKKLYADTLQDLREYGLGGVIINGIYRDIQ